MTVTMNRYLITRHGSNAANQSMTLRMDVAIVLAPTSCDAVNKALDTVTVYNNQRLSAIHVNSAPARVRAFEEAAS